MHAKVSDRVKETGAFERLPQDDWIGRRRRGGRLARTDRQQASTLVTPMALVVFQRAKRGHGDIGRQGSISGF